MQKWPRIFTAGALLASLMLPTLPASGQVVPDTGIQKREENQQQRIQQGVQAGQLSPKEAEGLQKQQQAIQSRENRLKSDGNLSASERRRLQRQERRASHRIYRERRNQGQVPKAASPPAPGSTTPAPPPSAQ